MRTFVLSTLAALIFVTPIRAQGLLHRLPADGEFVRFEMESTPSNEKGEAQKTHKGTLTMSSVGETKVDGKPARWLEIKMEAQTPGDHTVKVLVPSERLKAGESPLDHAITGWRKMSEGDPKEITGFKTDNAGALPMLLPGPLTNAKKLPKKIVETALGKLECEGQTGTHAFEPAKDFKSEITYETWLHDDAPFGVVSARLDMKTIHINGEGRTWTMALRLAGVGKGAISELSDKQ